MKNWIQKAIKRRGRVRRYLRKKYGKKAFRDGIKEEYIDKALKELKKSNKSLRAGLMLAKRLKKMRKKSKKKK